MFNRQSEFNGKMVMKWEMMRSIVLVSRVCDGIMYGKCSILTCCFDFVCHCLSLIEWRNSSLIFLQTLILEKGKNEALLNLKIVY